MNSLYHFSIVHGFDKQQIFNTFFKEKGKKSLEKGKKLRLKVIALWREWSSSNFPQFQGS